MTTAIAGLGQLFTVSRPERTVFGKNLVGLLCMLVLVGGGIAACAPGAAPTPTTAPSVSPKAPAAPPAATAAVPTAAPAAAAPKAPAKVEVVRYGEIFGAANYWQVFIANDMGFFEKEGLKLEVTVVNTTDRAAQALAGGSLDISGISTDTGIRAVEQGAGITIIGGLLNRAVYSLMVAKNVNSFVDLKGKTLGVGALKDGSTVLLKKLLAKNGLVEKKDYDLVPVGGTGARAAAVQNGTIAAAMVSQPSDFQLMGEGIKRLGLSTDALLDFQFETNWVKKDWAKQNEDKVVRFLRAKVAADKWLYDPKNREQAISILSKNTKIEEQYSAQTYDLLIKQIEAFPKAGEVNGPGLKSVVETMVELGDLQKAEGAEKYFDLSYLEKAKK